MKYIYKHGNQFWYQRAVPLKIQKIIGKTTIDEAKDLADEGIPFIPLPWSDDKGN